jgi:hypothetical protein
LSGLSDCLKQLSAHGDPPQALGHVPDFEVCRPRLMQRYLDAAGGIFESGFLDVSL